MQLLQPGASYQGKARGEYASRAPRSFIHMHPKNLPDAYRKKGLKAVHKRLYRERTREYAAKNEEATEMRQQQQCILNGGVYLCHRFGKARSEGYVPLLSHMGTIPQWCEVCNLGVQAFRRARNRDMHSPKVVHFIQNLCPRCPGKEYSSWVGLQQLVVLFVL